MRSIAKKGLAAVTAVSLLGAAYGVGRDHEARPFTKGPVAEVSAKAPLEPELGHAAVCFGLGVLRSSLGPKGESSLYLWSDGDSIMGESFTSDVLIARAAATVEMVLDPTGDGGLPASEAGVMALNAAQVSRQAIPSVQAEGRAAGSLTLDNFEEYSDSEAPEEALGMLEQARNQTDFALEANDCDPELSGVYIANDFRYDAYASMR